MDSTYENDVLSTIDIDMDDLGVRPLDWSDLTKNFDDPFKDLFGKEKTIDFTVYSAEFQSINNKTKLTTDEDESSMSDDEDGINHYDIDPETGEKIFREVAFASNISLSSPNDKWIEEYLSSIESSSNQLLPTTINNSEEFLLENLEFSLIDHSNDQTNPDWLSNLISSNENSDHTMFTDLNENKSILNDSIDDEYSTSSSSSQTLIETKLEKIEHNENPLSHMMVRRSSIRSISQGQQDENALHEYNIPLTLDDITQTSTEEYNRHLTRLSHLTSEQMNIIKDIRRRGKNKIAAQNCRKRKAIGVESLGEEVDELKRVKHELEERKRAYQQQIAETRNQYEYLHRQVLPDRQLLPAIIVK